MYVCMYVCIGNILKMPLIIYKREEGFIFISKTLCISKFVCPFSLGTTSVLLCHYYMISYLSKLYLPNVLSFILISFNFFFTACLSVSVKKGELYFHTISIITTMAKFHFGNSFQ